jgi:hypothetical protein
MHPALLVDPEYPFRRLSQLVSQQPTPLPRLHTTVPARDPGRRVPPEGCRDHWRSVHSGMRRDEHSRIGRRRSTHLAVLEFSQCCPKRGNFPCQYHRLLALLNVRRREETVHGQSLGELDVRVGLEGTRFVRRICQLIHSITRIGKCLTFSFLDQIALAVMGDGKGSRSAANYLN